MPSLEPDHLSLADAVTSGLNASDDPDAPYFDDETADAELSRARSRRLVSGYRFGNPPSPVVGVRRAVDAAALDADVEVNDPEEVEGVAPSNDSDSPPLTEPEASPVVETEEIGDVVEGVQSLDLPASTSAVTVNAVSPESTGGSTSASRLPGPLAAPLHKATAARRRSERSRFDALTGLHDGEADADASAPLAEQGSEAYLKGEAPYAFPKHRLRKTMKGEFPGLGRMCQMDDLCRHLGHVAHHQHHDSVC